MEEDPYIPYSKKTSFIGYMKNEVIKFLIYYALHMCIPQIHVIYTGL
jgi:hypothetical protein